jgi:serine protease AprX
MARTHEASGESRSSALWGTGNRGGDHRSNALRGRCGRGLVVTTLGALSLVLPLSAGADDSTSPTPAKTYIAPALYQAAEKNPRSAVHVIIQNASGTDAAEESFETTEDTVKEVEKEADAAAREADQASQEQQQASQEQQAASQEAQQAAVEADQASRKARRADKKAAAKAYREAERAARAAEREARQAEQAAKRAEQARQRAAERAQRALERAAKRDKLGPSKLGKLLDELDLIGAVSVEMPAGWVYLLEQVPGLTVTLDAPVKVTGFSAKQLWAHQNGASLYWGTPANPGPKPPTIAIVDSGIEKGLLSFGDGKRIIDRQKFTSLSQDGSKLDGRGHGTFVAGIAAGEAPYYTGVAPRADLVDVDVMDDSGMARTSDVIKACEWILANKESKNIRVANFSLHSSSVLSIRYHPLNKAVEKLWFSGVVVVAAAGNYGKVDGPSGVMHAPGNDPFVITVGAYDLEGSARISNHDVPFWSAHGYTNEGFAKPDVVAAGRYMVGPAPVGATMGVERPDRIVAPGYLKLSGTSFAAPIVSGIAAQILARKPSWTPDQVKGAIMMSGRRMPDATLLEQGRGEVNLVRALALSNPVNPNKSLNRFVVPDPTGGSLFDGNAFYTAVTGDAAWDSAAWQDAAWSSAAWQDAAWGSAAWQDAAWQDAAWQDAAWQDSTSYEDNVAGEPVGAEEVVDTVDAEALTSDPELAVPGAEIPVVPAPSLP